MSCTCCRARTCAKRRRRSRHVFAPRRRRSPPFEVRRETIEKSSRARGRPSEIIAAGDQRAGGVGGTIKHDVCALVVVVAVAAAVVELVFDAQVEEIRAPKCVLQTTTISVGVHSIANLLNHPKRSIEVEKSGGKIGAEQVEQLIFTVAVVERILSCESSGSWRRDREPAHH